MYLYNFLVSNPEGTDYTFNLKHNEKYTVDQFDKICEDILIEHYKENMGDVFLAFSSDKLFKKFKERGFESAVNDIQAFYDIDPYWGTDHLPEELKKLMEENEKEKRRLRREKYKKMEEEEKK